MTPWNYCQHCLCKTWYFWIKNYWFRTKEMPKRLTICFISFIFYILNKYMIGFPSFNSLLKSGVGGQGQDGCGFHLFQTMYHLKTTWLFSSILVTNLTTFFFYIQCILEEYFFLGDCWKRDLRMNGRTGRQPNSD